MSSTKILSSIALVCLLTLPQAGHSAQTEADAAMPQPTLAVAPAQETPPTHMDPDLIREHENFSLFARHHVARMNATIIGGKSHMRVLKGADGLYRASFRAIDMNGVVCQVRRSESNPHFFVGNLIYKEQVLQSVGKSADSCRQGPFEPVSEKPNRLIFTSSRGGGWR